MTTTALSTPVRTGLAALIGGTPMMAIEVERGIAVHAKIAMSNPLSSIKYRVALYMIEGVERRPAGRRLERRDPGQVPGVPSLAEPSDPRGPGQCGAAGSAPNQLATAECPRSSEA